MGEALELIGELKKKDSQGCDRKTESHERQAQREN